MILVLRTQCRADKKDGAHASGRSEAFCPLFGVWVSYL